MRPGVFYLRCFYANTNYEHRSALRGIKSDLESSAQRYVILQAMYFQEIDHRSCKLVFERSVQNEAEGKKAIIVSELISWVYRLCRGRHKQTLPQSHIPPRYGQPRCQMTRKAVWAQVCAALSRPGRSRSTQGTGRAHSHLLRCQQKYLLFGCRRLFQHIHCWCLLLVLHACLSTCWD